MYTIGEFSKFTNVTVKTLRYYDEIGLLKPSYIDQKTNFRYYDYIKFSEIEKIIFFKNLDFSLVEIKKLVADTRLSEDALVSKEQELIKEKEAITSKIEQIQLIKKLNKTEPDKGYFFSTINQTFYSERYYVAIKKMITIDEIDCLVEDLMALIFSYNLKIKGNLIGHFTSKIKGKQLVQLMFEVENKGNVPDEYLFKLEEGYFLSMNFIGLYTYLPEAYAYFIKELKDIKEPMFFEEYLEGLVPNNINEKNYKIKPAKENDPRQFVTKIFTKA